MIVGLGVAIGPDASDAQAPDPTELEDAAYQDFAAGRLVEALRGYERVYRLAPRPEILFAIGNLHQQLGDCDRAIETFEDYLATGATAGTDKARAQIAACRATLDAPTAVAPAAPIEPAVAVAVTVPRDDDRGRGRRRGALVLSGVAVVAAGGAIASELVGRSHLRASDQRRGDGRLREGQAELDTANRYHKLAQGVAIASVGCAAIATGLWLTGRRRSASAVAVAPTAGGAMMSWSGGF